MCLRKETKGSSITDSHSSATVDLTMTRILVDAAFEVVRMFRGLRDSIAMERLLSAFDRRTRYPRMYQAIDAKPAPSQTAPRHRPSAEP